MVAIFTRFNRKKEEEEKEIRSHIIKMRDMRLMANKQLF